MAKPTLLGFVKKKVIEAYNKKPDYKAQSRMRPSYVGTPCERQIFYSYLRVDPDKTFDEDSVNNFLSGDAIAVKVKNQLRMTGTLIDYIDPKTGEIPIHWKTKEPDPEFPVDSELLNMKNAKIDAVLNLQGVEGYKDGIWLVEIKSTKQKNLEGRFALKEPKPEHMVQGNLYIYTFEDMLSKGAYDHIPQLKGVKKVQGIIFIYVAKDQLNWDWEEFVVEKGPKTEKLFLETGDKLFRVMDHVEQGKLPEKTEHMCPWCPYQTKCRENWNPLKK